MSNSWTIVCEVEDGADPTFMVLGEGLMPTREVIAKSMLNVAERMLEEVRDAAAAG